MSDTRLEAAAPAGSRRSETAVLVVDDEEGMREGMRRILERAGYGVTTAADGGEAMARLGEQVFDVALIDLKMPGIDGFQVTEHVNESRAGRTVVVIVSALATVEAAVEVTRHGAFDFLVKPFGPEDLLEVTARAASQCRLFQERETYLTELNSERNLSRQLINSMREGLVVLNIDRKPVLMNPRAELLLGVRYSGGLALEALGLTPEAFAAVEELFAPGSATGRFRRVRFERDGRMLELHVTPYMRGDERAGLILLLQDATEEWGAEQERNRFVSMVAHELTSPLAAIVSYINVVLEGMLDKKPERIKEIMARSKVRAEGLLDLVKDLQFLTRSDARRVERSAEELDLAAVIREQLEFFRGQAERRGITLALEGPERAPCVADPGDLDRIFGNLVSNGIKYNLDGGSLTVTISRSEGGWEIGFRDTGIGMSREETSGLFEDFYRVRNLRTQGIPGTGLGLATVRRVLDEYNGSITVESAPGEGSTFRVLLPAAGIANGGGARKEA